MRARIIRPNPRTTVRRADASFALVLLALPITDYFVVYFLSQLYLAKFRKYLLLRLNLRADYSELLRDSDNEIQARLHRHGATTLQQIPYEEALPMLQAKRTLRVMVRHLNRYLRKIQAAMHKHREFMGILGDQIKEHNETSENKINWHVREYGWNGTSYLRRNRRGDAA